MEKIDDESMNAIDGLEDLIFTLREQLHLTKGLVEKNKADVEKQESELRKSKTKLDEEERSLKSVQDGFFVWNKSEKIRNHEKEIKRMREDVNKYEKKLKELRHPEMECENIEKSIEGYSEKMKKLEEKEKKTTDEPWRYIKDNESVFCERTRDYFLHRFNTLDLSENLSKWKEGESSKFANIILIGSTGCGKSSFINTCKTALKNSGDMAFASVDQGIASPSATIRLILAPLRFSNGDHAPIRLFDCRGIQKDIGHDVIEKVISGHVKPNSKISDVPEMEGDRNYNVNPTIYNQMHCIVYVVRADRLGTQNMVLDKSIEEIHKIRKQYTEKNIPQCVLVTYVDLILPSNNMKHIFHHQIARRYCRRASEIFQIPLKYVHPMSNYHDEGIPTPEKDALALDILWKLTRMALDHIDNHINRSDTLEGFYD